MNNSLQVFNPRAAFITEYSVPAEDVLSDDGTFSLYVPDAPLIRSVILGRIRFNAVENADGYKLYRKLGSGPYAVILSSDDPEASYMDSGDIVYDGFYKIIAFNTVGDSLPSPAMLLFNPKFTLNEGTAVGHNRFTVTWGPSADATKYRLFTSNFPDYSDDPAGVSTYADTQTGIDCGTNLTCDIGQRDAYVSGWEWYRPRFCKVVSYSAGNDILATSNEVVVISDGVSSISPITADNVVEGVEMTPLDFDSAGSFLPTVWSLTPLPAGLSFNTATGILSGTPTVVAVNALTVTATDAQHEYSIDVTLEVEAAPMTLRIASYGTEGEPLFVADPSLSADDSTDPEWDGTFLPQTVNWDYSAGVDWFATPFSVSGKQLVLVYAVGPVLGIPGMWQLNIATRSDGAGNGYGKIWNGRKVGGDTDTPVGVYEYNDGTDLRATVTLEFALI